VNAKSLLLALVLALAPLAATPAGTVAPPDAPVQFHDPAEEARFRALAAELRCVMCQNQSLADSDAPIAHDLRAQVLEMMRAGRSDDEIKQYLVARYSEFVLYAPTVRPATWLLWFGPLLAVAGGGLFIATIVRRRGRALVAGSTPASTDETDQEW
jgi:cytochrome c-type biogenesis protein CcmH